jgi:FG-GAP-like repeat
MNSRNEKFATIFGIAGLLAFMTIAAAASTVQFKPAQSYTVGANPVAVAIGDFNKDGDPDLAVLNSGSNNMTILLGKGDGRFQSAGNFAAGIPADSTVIPTIAIGDFNGDGKADLAVLVPPDGNTAPGEVHILMGNGDGTLQAPIFTTLETNVTVMAVADFNGDKKADLVANLFDGSGIATGVEVLLGNGDGTFQTPKTVVTGAESVLTVADYNNDGRPDLAVSASNAVQMMKGKGDGTFSQGGQAVLAGGFGAQKAWTADLNGDGKLDLIVDSWVSGEGTCGGGISCFQGTQHVSVFLGNGDGTFAGEQIFATGSSTTLGGGLISNAVLYNGAGDFNGDGKLDIAATTLTQNQPAFAISLGNEDGTFSSPIGLPDPGNVVRAEDLNGDGLSDLVVLDAANNSIDVLLNATPAFSLTVSTNTLTANAGNQVTDALSLTGVNGFSSALQLTCQVVGPAPAPTCSFSPTSIAAGAGSSTSTLTISVPATSAGLLSPQNRLPLQALYALAFPFAFVGLGFRRKQLDPRYQRWMLGASLATAALLCTACGGGVRGSLTPVHQATSYTVRVTAASDILTKTTQISMNVQ